MSEIITVKLSALAPAFKPYLQLAMVSAKKNCHRCHGRGRLGINIKNGVNIPCSCLVVDLEALKASIATAKAATEKLIAETPAPAAQPSPGVENAIHP